MCIKHEAYDLNCDDMMHKLSDTDGISKSDLSLPPKSVATSTYFSNNAIVSIACKQIEVMWGFNCNGCMRCGLEYLDEGADTGARMGLKRC